MIYSMKAMNRIENPLFHINKKVFAECIFCFYKWQKKMKCIFFSIMENIAKFMIHFHLKKNERKKS